MTLPHCPYLKPGASNTYTGQIRKQRPEILSSRSERFQLPLTCPYLSCKGQMGEQRPGMVGNWLPTKGPNSQSKASPHSHCPCPWGPHLRFLLLPLSLSTGTGGLGRCVCVCVCVFLCTRHAGASSPPPPPKNLEPRPAPWPHCLSQLTSRCVSLVPWLLFLNQPCGGPSTVSGFDRP